MFLPEWRVEVRRSCNQTQVCTMFLKHILPKCGWGSVEAWLCRLWSKLEVMVWSIIDWSSWLSPALDAWRQPSRRPFLLLCYGWSFHFHFHFWGDRERTSINKKKTQWKVDPSTQIEAPFLSEEVEDLRLSSLGPGLYRDCGTKNTARRDEWGAAG